MMMSVVNQLNLTYIEPRKTYEGSGDTFDMTAKFDKDGEEQDFKVLKSTFVMSNTDSTKLWMASRYAHLVHYYLDGGSPVKITTTHTDASVSHVYLGSLTDPRCAKCELDCKYVYVQPKTAYLMKEVIDANGWALMNIISAPDVADDEDLIYRTSLFE